MSKTKTKKYVSHDEFVNKRPSLKKLDQSDNFFLRLYEYDKYSYDTCDKYHVRKNREFVMMYRLAADVFDIIRMCIEEFEISDDQDNIVSFEDYIKPSMGGNRTSQIIDITNMLKMMMVSTNFCSRYKIMPFSSSTIKSNAGSGSFDKSQMVSSMVDRYPGVLNIEKSDWNKKPIDDVVDAFWINILTIKNFM